jgi:hypothetical protein
LGFEGGHEVLGIGEVYLTPKSSTTRVKKMSRVLCLQRPGVMGTGA